MSTRLQVVVEDSEMEEIQAAAKQSGQTVSAWVREALAAARKDVATGDVRRKLEAIHSGYRYSFPAPEPAMMLAEIEQGYLEKP